MLPIVWQLIVQAIMAFANESVISSILGGSDHSASKIHGQGAIHYEKILNFYYKRPIKNWTLF
jgi:hypothetical protein